MKQSTLAAAISAALLGASVFVGSAQAAPRLCDDGRVGMAYIIGQMQMLRKRAEEEVGAA